MRTFLTGFMQGFLVVINTYFISKSFLIGIIIWWFSHQLYLESQCEKNSDWERKRKNYL